MGLGCGRQKYAYLPYPESDFIFAIVGEDFGLIGCVAVILLFIAFLFAGMRIALTCPDTFGCLLAAGITCLICVQAFINMGVVVGVLPTTGCPCPSSARAAHRCLSPWRRWAWCCPSAEPASRCCAVNLSCTPFFVRHSMKA